MGRKRLDYNKILTHDELCNLSYTVAKKYALKHNLPKGYKYPMVEMNPPQCETHGCTNSKVPMHHHWFTGRPIYRKICLECHDRNTASRYAAKNKGAEWVKDVNDVVAHKNGFNSHREYLISIHPYLKYRKDYCENIDGRLGNTCTTNVWWDGMLDVDHIDENPDNNDPVNLQTLCKCCHAYKSNQFVKTYGRTPGRKTLKHQRELEQGLFSGLTNGHYRAIIGT